MFCMQVSLDYVVPHLTLKTIVGLTQNPRVGFTALLLAWSSCRSHSAAPAR